ncbi:MAG: pantoate--beta-alanine ligase [Elusimicrobia bacterium]|nr:pantoate--beta-alanine ligase [Elusimicrobiota bacterium]
MKIIKTPAQFKKVKKVTVTFLKNKTIGFVPTMGALHDGHLSLVRRSLKENDFTAVSIFVNPVQFNDKKDFNNYPNTLKQDIAKLKKANVDFLFLPRFKDIYPDKYRYRIIENSLSRLLCGAFRPGHFDGVLTIVMKLFNIIGADRAYFGEKDYQQYMLVKDMAEAFFHKTAVIGCPTAREKDGLAISSRNLRLSPEQRKIAPELYRILKSAKNEKEAVSLLRKKGFSPEYVEEMSGRRLAAAWLGKVRLIDNVKIR